MTQVGPEAVAYVHCGPCAFISTSFPYMRTASATVYRDPNSRDPAQPL